ncbi:hypothetical protein [Cupriavidus sp. AU9028]|uniref:helix-turn-helix domain-containing protein n=1 Tax=Cupriavidus sp. AU9028 TaxID=2871157 RepID=UPI001C93D2F2|nr:hypothetical protein [Cupriavidus sp. AU9028]MBY4899169.1 hypothetical protein [Cupriavidus sp. AU9028]
MRSLADIASFLRDRLHVSRVTQRVLGEEAGIARRTLTAVLSGQADYKVSTLLSVLDRLGYEIAIVPKDAAAGLAAPPGFQPTQPAVKTVVASARERLQQTAPSSSDQGSSQQ